MKELSKSISFNESRQVEYRVKFIGFDESVSIYVDKSASSEFEQFLEDEQDNVFEHAFGGDIEY